MLSAPILFSVNVRLYLLINFKLVLIHSLTVSSCFILLNRSGIQFISMLHMSIIKVVLLQAYLLSFSSNGKK